MNDSNDLLVDEEIDLTPFVETLLVLMATFVVLVAFQIHGITSELSRAGATAGQVSDGNALLVEIQEDGTLLINSRKSSVDEVLATIQSQSDTSQVLIAAHKNVQYATVLRLRIAISEIASASVTESYRPDSEG